MADPPGLSRTVAGEADEYSQSWMFVPIFKFFIFDHFHASWPELSGTCSVKLKDNMQLSRIGS